MIAYDIGETNRRTESFIGPRDIAWHDGILCAFLGVGTHTPLFLKEKEREKKRFLIVRSMLRTNCFGKPLGARGGHIIGLTAERYGWTDDAAGAVSWETFYYARLKRLWCILIYEFFSCPFCISIYAWAGFGEFALLAVVKIVLEKAERETEIR